MHMSYHTATLARYRLKWWPTCSLSLTQDASPHTPPSPLNPLPRQDRLVQGRTQLGRGQGVLFLAHLPEAQAMSFLVTSRQTSSLRGGGTPESRLAFRQSLGLNPGTDFKVFVILAIADISVVEPVLHAIQEGFPSKWGDWG